MFLRLEKMNNELTLTGLNASDPNVMVHSQGARYAQASGQAEDQTKEFRCLKLGEPKERRVEYNVHSWIRIEDDVEDACIHLPGSERMRDNPEPSQFAIPVGDGFKRRDEDRLYWEKKRSDSMVGLRGDSTKEDVSEDFNTITLGSHFQSFKKFNSDVIFLKFQRIYCLGSESVYSTLSLDKSYPDILSVSQTLHVYRKHKAESSNPNNKGGGEDILNLYLYNEHRREENQKHPEPEAHQKDGKYSDILD